MIEVVLVDDPRSHSFSTTDEKKVQPDCDCACPIDDLEVPVLDIPTFYSLELTPSCNNRCPGCSNIFFEDVPNRIQLAPVRSPLPFDSWLKILDIITPYVTRLKITGGEATLHPDFEQIITEVEMRGVTFTLFTNARWKDARRTVDFLKTKSFCAGVLISLHGTTETAHEKFTGIKGSFGETLKNIKLATEAGISVHISCVFTQHNLTQIRDVVELSKRLGASATVFNRFIGPPLSGISISPQQLTRAITEVEMLRSKGESTHFGTCIPQCFAESSSVGCLAGIAYCTIDPWGNIRPCNHTPWITGNILTDSLQKPWKSERMNYWRNLIPDGCNNCSAYAKCRGGCRADAVLNDITQDPLMQQPLIFSLETIEPKAVQKQLYGHAEIGLNCEIFDRGSDRILVRGDKILPITRQMEPILRVVNARYSLQDVHNELGQSALNLIFEFYEQGFFTLTW